MTDGSGFPPPPPPPPRWEEPSPPPYDPASEKLLKPVGITMVVYNAISIATVLAFVPLLGFFRELLAKEAQRDRNLQPVADFYANSWLDTVCWLGAGLAIVGLIGSIFLLRGRNYGLAMTGAIVTMLNPAACCCPLNVAFGIWALVVLLKPEAHAVFNRP